jgi:hypothetical protein
MEAAHHGIMSVGIIWGDLSRIFQISHVKVPPKLVCLLIAATRSHVAALDLFQIKQVGGLEKEAMTGTDEYPPVIKHGNGKSSTNG